MELSTGELIARYTEGLWKTINLREEYEGRFKFCKLNVDESQRTAVPGISATAQVLIELEGAR